MSDAHLHTTCPKCIERAAELEQLAGENAQLREALAEFAHLSGMLGKPGLTARVDALLTSAGPPQEASPLSGAFHNPETCRGFDCATHGFRPSDPPPGSGCTKHEPGHLGGTEFCTMCCTDPACPEHGR